VPFAPFRHGSSSAARAEGVKGGRCDAPASRADVARPSLDAFEHDATLVAAGTSLPSAPSLQDRLPKELRLAGITTIDAANAWLEEHYKAEHNRQFAIAPDEDGTAFVPDRAGRDILCVIEERVVGSSAGCPSSH
jgi:hypothetical protein